MNDKKELKKILISTILEHIPQGQYPTPYIANILNMEREYIYRRLRGETNFSMNEIAKLAIHLGFSIDNVVGLNNNNALFDFNLLTVSTPEDIYLKQFEEYVPIIEAINATPSANVMWAGNTIPFAMFSHYKVLSKFHFYRWIYQTTKTRPDYKLSDLSISNKLQAKLEQYFFKLKPSVHSTFIIDNNFFISIIRNIEYYFSRGLINKNEISEFKNELIDLLSILDYAAEHGHAKDGGKMSLYICPINIRYSCTNTEFENKCFCQFSVFSINTLNTYNKRICNIQRNWIESIKRFSTLITQCNEYQRYEYFETQKKIINQIGVDN